MAFVTKYLVGITLDPYKATGIEITACVCVFSPRRQQNCINLHTWN